MERMWPLFSLTDFFVFPHTAMKAAGVPVGLYSEKPEGYLMAEVGKISLKTFQEEGFVSFH